MKMKKELRQTRKENKYKPEEKKTRKDVKKN